MPRQGKRVVALLLGLAITVAAAVQYRSGGGFITVAWLTVGPLLASLVLPVRFTAVLAGWAALLGGGLLVHQPGRPGALASHLGVLVLLAGFAVANAALRTAAQRRLGQVRAVARVAQSAVLREVPATITAAGWPRGTSRPRRRRGWVGTSWRSSPRESARAG